MYKWPVNIQRVQSSKPPAWDQIPSLTPPQKAFRCPPLAGGGHETSGESILGQLFPCRMRGRTLAVLHPHWSYPGPSSAPSNACKTCTSWRRQELHPVESLMGDRKFPEHPSWRLNSLFVHRELDNGMTGQKQRHFQRPSCLVSCNTFPLNIADTIHFKRLKLKGSLPLEKCPPAPKYDQWGN